MSELFVLIWGFITLDKNIRVDGLKKMLISPVVGCTGIVLIGLVAQNIFTESWLISIVTIIVSIIWYFTVMIVSKNEFFVGLINPVVNKLKGSR